MIAFRTLALILWVASIRSPVISVELFQSSVFSVLLGTYFGKLFMRYDLPRGQQRYKPIVKVKVVREAVHQNDGRFLARILPSVNVVLASRHSMLFDIHFLSKESPTKTSRT